jgi:general secretion pathway protein A
MYTTFYGLTELPFELSPNPRYLLLTPRHREALANLQYGIAARKSLTLLLGEAGTGKTTLVHAALGSDACRNARILHLANPVLTRDEFIDVLARGFVLSDEARRSKTALLAELESELLERRRQGITTALLVDEAQSLPHELLEEVRLRANIETATEKLLSVVLVGQPELAERLREPSLRQLKQRIALRCTLGLLQPAETAAYIKARLQVAGANGREIFSEPAIRLVHECSGGVPRTISVICDNELVGGFAAGTAVIGPDIVREVCADFDFAPGQVADARGRPPAAPLAGPKPSADASGQPFRAAADRLFANYGKRKRFSFF